MWSGASTNSLIEAAKSNAMHAGIRSWRERKKKNLQKNDVSAEAVGRGSAHSFMLSRRRSAVPKVSAAWRRRAVVRRPLWHIFSSFFVSLTGILGSNTDSIVQNWTELLVCRRLFFSFLFLPYVNLKTGANAQQDNIERREINDKNEKRKKTKKKTTCISIKK